MKKIQEAVRMNKTQKNNSFLFVGIMSNEDYLQTRAKVALDTWVHTIQGDVKFFTTKNPEISSKFKDNIVIKLPLTKVQDGNTPQRKSFLILKYMYKKYLNSYDWFMKVDDYIFINGEKLFTFLTSLDSRMPYYIGRPGLGRPHKREKLGLQKGMTYCMAGCGVILSRTTLEALGPHIDECINNVYTKHEDTEVGRCVYKFVGIPCVEFNQVRKS